MDAQQTADWPFPRIRESLTPADLEAVINTVEQMTAAQQRHAVGQQVMVDENVAKLVALYMASDERGKKTIMCIAGINARISKVGV